MEHNLEGDRGPLQGSLTKAQNSNLGCCEGRKIKLHKEGKPTIYYIPYVDPANPVIVPTRQKGKIITISGSSDIPLKPLLQGGGGATNTYPYHRTATGRFRDWRKLVQEYCKEVLGPFEIRQGSRHKPHKIPLKPVQPLKHLQ